MRIIDNHCLFGRWPRDDRDVSLERLLEVLDGLGVERGVCTSLRGAFHSFEEGNAETLAACAKHEALVPAATINPRQYYARASLPAKLVKRGFRMLRLFPSLQGWSLESVVVERILGECAKARLPVAFPTGKFPDLASRLSRIAPRGCRVILSDAYYNELAECVEVMRRRREFFMELGHTCVPGSVEFLCKELGARRLVLGTNQPLESGRGAIEAIRRSKLGARDKAAILGGNLARLLGGI